MKRYQIGFEVDAGHLWWRRAVEFHYTVVVGKFDEKFGNDTWHAVISWRSSAAPDLGYMFWEGDSEYVALYGLGDDIARKLGVDGPAGILPDMDLYRGNDDEGRIRECNTGGIRAG